MQAVPGTRCRRREGFLEKRNADSFRAAHLLERGRRPRLAFHHLGKQRQPDADDLPFLGQAGDRALQEVLLLPGHIFTIFRKRAKRLTESRQHFSGMTQVKQIRGGKVAALNELDLQLPEKANQGHPKIIAHQDEALHPTAVALPQRLHQLRVRFVFPGMQPLFELVQDQQDFLGAGIGRAKAQRRQRLFQAEIGRKLGIVLAETVQQPDFRVVLGGLDVNGNHFRGQARQQAGLDQR